MSITTIVPKNEVCCNEDRVNVLCLLKSQMNFPVELEAISQTLKIPLWRVERVVTDLEGHITGEDGGENAYLHRARCSSRAVYIS
ncbi:MAG: hypothetical protein WC828_00505 [Thermoleophilia bacterium]